VESAVHIGGWFKKLSDAKASVVRTVMNLLKIVAAELERAGLVEKVSSVVSALKVVASDVSIPSAIGREHANRVEH